MAWRATLPSDEVPSGLGRGISSRNRRATEPSTSYRGRLAEEEVKAVLKQALSGLEYLHSQQIVHVRDR
jgi:serine/threonine protein kinase